MDTHKTTDTTQTDAPEFTGRATYSPEDNKLRLYVGRVPRDEFLKLRAEGWTTLHKQREAGGGDFVAVWTPGRRDTALSYAGIIEDEDMGPEERAADRAERFGGYRDRRADEASATADRFDAGPAAHGFQSQARAERAARRHDRIAGRAVDAWDKAEYWQQRTAVVISHRLHLSSPGVRMGRIKTLEAELRGLRARWERTGEEPNQSAKDWIHHTELRLAYENQMIEAQGGRLAFVEIEAGGTFGGHVIAKVNKSQATGRVVSVHVIGAKVDGWTHRASNVPGTEYALHQFDTERAKPDAYKAPTEESRAKLAEFEAAKKSAAVKRKAVTPPCPLVNPTDADAERLQAAFNDHVRLRWEKHAKERPHSYTPEFRPSSILRITQLRYSDASKGTYARAEASNVCAGAIQEPTAYNYDGRHGPAVCKVRTTSGENYMADRVIVLTDKPQKPLPAAVWEPLAASITNATGDWQAKHAGASARAKEYEAKPTAPTVAQPEFTLT